MTGDILPDHQKVLDDLKGMTPIIVNYIGYDTFDINLLIKLYDDNDYTVALHNADKKFICFKLRENRDG